MRLFSTLLLLACLCPTRAEAQAKTVVLKSGDPIAGSPIRQFNKIAISDNGSHYTEVRTVAPNGSSNHLALADGSPVLAESDPLPAPSGASVAWFNDLDVNASGAIGWPLGVNNRPSTSDTGIYWNTKLLVLEGGPVGAASFNGLAFGGNTTYHKFFSVKINDNDSLLASCEIQDPSRGGSNRERALVILRTDGAGALLQEKFAAVERFPFLTTGESFSGVGQDINNIGFNNNDGWIAVLKAGSDLTKDSLLVMNDQVLAREGSPSPVAGRNYTDLSGTKCDLNDFDEFVFTAFLDGNTSNNVILNVNGQIYAREGFSFPAIAPFNVDRFDADPMYIANSGDVYWYAKSGGNPTDDQFYLRNREVILQENTTLLSSGLVAALRTTQYAFHVSKSGRFWMAEIVPEDGGEELVMADFGAVIRLPGCAGNPGTLDRFQGDARLGQVVMFEMGGAQGAGAIPFIWWSSQPAVPGSKCGVSGRFGETLVDVTTSNRILLQAGPASTGTPTRFAVSIPFDASLIGLKAYGQGIWLDRNGVTSGPGVLLTNGYVMEVGA